MIKLVASDLDGTLIDQNNNIYENNFKAIEDLNKSNRDFVICTGKTYNIMKESCLKLNASFGIFGNGNQIVDLRNGKEIYKKLLTVDELSKCIDIAKKHNLHIHAYSDEEIISENLLYMDLRNYKLKEKQYYGSNLDFKIVKDIKEYILNNNIQVCKLIISSISSLTNVKSEILDDLQLSVTTISKRGQYKDTIINKEYEYLDIAPLNISKNNALKILGNYLNIDNSEIMAIGDNLNDLEMIRKSGVGVAVANAYDEIKQVAKYTTINPVEKGGFAEAVYKFVEF